jgi:hypothetical protein
MKTMSKTEAARSQMFAPRFIALLLLTGILLVLGLKVFGEVRQGGTDATQVLPGGWAGDCTVLD